MTGAATCRPSTSLRDGVRTSASSVEPQAATIQELFTAKERMERKEIEDVRQVLPCICGLSFTISRGEIIMLQQSASRFSHSLRLCASARAVFPNPRDLVAIPVGRISNVDFDAAVLSRIDRRSRRTNKVVAAMRVIRAKHLECAWVKMRSAPLALDDINTGSVSGNDKINFAPASIAPILRSCFGQSGL